MTGLAPPSSRALGLRTRLLGLILIPSVGLGSLVVPHLVNERADAAEADAVAAEVDTTVSALETFIGANGEFRLSRTIVAGGAFGLPPDVVNDLLDLDIGELLDEFRARVDASPTVDGLLEDLGGRAALHEARAAIDRGGATDDSIMAELAGRALADWTARVDAVAEREGSRDARGSLAASLDNLQDAAAVYRFATLQILSAANAALPGLDLAPDSPGDVDVLAASLSAALADLRASADGDILDDVEAIIADRRFDDILAQLPRVQQPSDPINLDLVATLIDVGLERDDAIQAVTTEVAVEAREHARATGVAARSRYHRLLAVLIAVVTVSVALTVLVARSVTRPLTRLERRAAEISDGDLDGTPLPLSGPREAAVLAATLNDAVANLHSVERQAAALASGDVEGAASATGTGKLAALLHRSVDGLTHSIRERDVLQHQLRYDADHDGLTGLANRRVAMAELDALLDGPGPPIAVLFFDVDGLKAINDGLGHAVGDRLLLGVAERLAIGAPRGSLVARLGGDEFVIATAIGDGAVALALADRILAELDDLIVVDGAARRVGASAGVALSQAGESADDVLRWADVAMYEAKRSGRGRAVLLDDDLRAGVHQDQQLDVELRQAIVDGDLEVHYQPIFDTVTGGLHSVEALVRWRRSDGTLMAPDRFIGVAEQTGAITGLDRWVLRTATRQVATWRRDRFPGLRLAVNVSARTLLHPRLVAEVAAALDAAGLDPTALDVEVTETALLNDLDTAAVRIDDLHQLGVRTAIDDFGTGYTSVSQLRRLPVDQVKIDRSFVSGLDDERDRLLVDLVVRIGRTLGIEVVAEGVETDAQLGALRVLGCQLVQGYLLGRPVPPAELEAQVFSRILMPADSATHRDGTLSGSTSANSS